MTPGLALARRIVLAPAWILSVALLAPNLLVGPLSGLRDFDLAWRALNALFLVVDMAWIWSVYTVSIAAMPERPRPAWVVWIFTVPIVIHLVATAANLSMRNSPPAFLFFAAFLFCLGRTAIELETADRREAPATLGKTLGVAALLFFSPIGVWWLRERLLRIAARTVQT